MRNPVAIEDIEAMRRREGIEDVELREEIRGLQVGDTVKLTFRPSLQAVAGETLSVRITSIRGGAFRGKLATRPISAGLAHLHVGSPVAFTTAHIHSLAKGQPARER
jgi:hypothetical protein